jgi:hypothetical protein
MLAIQAMQAADLGGPEKFVKQYCVKCPVELSAMASRAAA